MIRHYKNNIHPYPNYIYQNNDERFIGPILPFVGGALIGYIAGRPNYYYPVYYPPYYQPYPNYIPTYYNNN